MTDAEITERVEAWIREHGPRIRDQYIIDEWRDVSERWGASSGSGFSVGRWTIYLFNLDAIGCWTWKRRGYDGLWDEWGFGFLLQLERETDYLLDLAERYPPKRGNR